MSQLRIHCVLFKQRRIIKPRHPPPLPLPPPPPPPAAAAPPAPASISSRQKPIVGLLFLQSLLFPPSRVRPVSPVWAAVCVCYQPYLPVCLSTSLWGGFWCVPDLIKFGAKQEP